MTKIPKNVKLLTAGLLLALTAFTAGLTMSVAFNAGASAPASSATATGEASFTEESAPASSPDGDVSSFDINALAQFFTSNGPGAAMEFFQGARGFMDSYPAAAGTISKIDGTGLTLSPGNRVVNTNGSTKFGDAKGELNFADLKPGDLVAALGAIETDKSLTARWVLRLPALPAVQRGTITSVTASSNQFKFKSGSEEFTATVSGATTYIKNGNNAAFTDLAVNDNVTVFGTVDKAAKTVTASRVSVGNPGQGKNIPNRGTRGTVKSIDTANNSIVVTEKVNNADADVTVKVDANTKFTGQNLKSLADLKTGDTVIVSGDKQSDSSVKATAIARIPAGLAGPRGNNGGPKGNGSSQGGFFGNPPRNQNNPNNQTAPSGSSTKL